MEIRNQSKTGAVVPPLAEITATLSRQKLPDAPQGRSAVRLEFITRSNPANNRCAHKCSTEIGASMGSRTSSPVRGAPAPPRFHQPEVPPLRRRARKWS